MGTGYAQPEQLNDSLPKPCIARVSVTRPPRTLFPFALSPRRLCSSVATPLLLCSSCSLLFFLFQVRIRAFHRSPIRHTYYCICNRLPFLYLLASAVFFFPVRFPRLPQLSLWQGLDFNIFSGRRQLTGAAHTPLASLTQPCIGRFSRC